MHTSADEEAEIGAFLANPETHSLRGERVHAIEVIETHCARVFLAGDDVYKIKKRVKFSFLDFTTLEKRFAACQREIDLNKPYAPSIYLGLIRLSRSADGHLNLTGDGETVDWAVHMRRFDQASVLDRMADARALPEALPRKLARMVAEYHRRSNVHATTDGANRVRKVVEGLTAGLLSTGGATAMEAARTFSVLADCHLSGQTKLLDVRAASGAIRRCHGDLHLGNIVLMGDEPVPFDALEFSEDLATVDVLYDLAFLLMDLDHRGLRPEANAVLNGYVVAAPLGSEIGGLACLPLFLACRAAVRAVVTFELATQKHPSDSHEILAKATSFLSSAVGFMERSSPVAIAIGGLSGSGKSTLGRSLAPSIGRAPGAVHLRSDVERKRLAGRDELERLGPEHYTIEASRSIYAHLEKTAQAILSTGHSVVIDAVFARPEERISIADAASRAGAEFIGFWLDASEEQLIARVEARQGDASDATSNVVRSQMNFDLGEIAWRRLDATRGQRNVFDAALGDLMTLMERGDAESKFLIKMV